MQKYGLFGAVLALSLGAAWTPTTAQAAGMAKAKEYLVYIGTYTNQGGSKGIYAYRFNPSTGEISNVGLEAETPSPSFLAADPHNKFLYAVNEVDNYEGKKAGSVSGWTIDRKTGKLTALNTVSTRGDGPCHLAVDKTGKALVVANYGGGSIASFPIGSDGRLKDAATFDQHTGKSADPQRQEAPHAHCTIISHDNRYVVNADLGLDRLMVYKLNPAAATLTPNDPPFASVKPGSGPRHFAFDPSAKHGYAINEIASTVTAFDYDKKKGSLQEIQTISTLPADFKGSSTTAEVFVHPNGKFLYGSNRGHDSIAVFAIDSASGKLTVVQHAPSGGKNPRNFAIDPTGKYLFAANGQSNNVVIFQIDGSTGKLTSTGKTLNVNTPVCVLFVPAK